MADAQKRAGAVYTRETTKSSPIVYPTKKKEVVISENPRITNRPPREKSPIYTTQRGSIFTYGKGERAKQLIGGNFGDGGDGCYRHKFNEKLEKKWNWNAHKISAVLFEWPTTCIVK